MFTLPAFISNSVARTREFLNSLNTKTLVAGVLVVLAAGIIIADGIHRDTTPTAQVKGASTTAAEPVTAESSEDTATTTATNSDAPTSSTTEAATDSKDSKKTSASMASNNKSSSKSNAGGSSSSSNTGSSSSTSSTKPNTPANPSPAPAANPTYRVILRSSSAATNVYTGYKQLVIPFDVTYDAGFVANSYEQPFCGFTATPTANHGALCNVSQKEADTGWLVVQYNDATAKGAYTVWMSYSVNGVTRTDSYSFTL